MGCTPSASTGTRAPTTCSSTSSSDALAVGRRRARRRRRVLARHDGLGPLGPHALPAAEDRVQAGHPRRELLRHRLARRSATPATPSPRGAYDMVMAIGVEKLKDSRLLGPRRSARRPTTAPAPPSPRRRRSACSPRPTPRSTASTRHELKDVLTRIAWKNHKQRRAEPAGAVPQGGVRRRPSRAAPRGRPARHLRLLGRQRRLGRGDHRARRGRPQVHRQSALREGAVVHRRPGRRARSTRATTTRPSPRSCARPRTPTSRPASRTRAPSWRWPRCTTASRRPSSCSWRTSGFAERGMAWKDVLAGTFDLDGELPVNPDGGLKSFGHPIGASGPAHAVRVLAPAARRGRTASDRIDRRRQDQGPHPQPRWRPRRVRQLRQRGRLAARLSRRLSRLVFRGRSPELR